MPHLFNNGPFNNRGYQSYHLLAEFADEVIVAAIVKRERGYCGVGKATAMLKAYREGVASVSEIAIVGGTLGCLAARATGRHTTCK